MIIGIDPGLCITGWAVLSLDCKLIDCGKITTNATQAIETRLLIIHNGLSEIIRSHHITESAIEKIFVNKNPSSTLLLGCARGVSLMTIAMLGASVHEYSPNVIKKSISGYGHATKDQMGKMINILIPSEFDMKNDIADASSVALCHFYHRRSNHYLNGHNDHVA